MPSLMLEEALSAPECVARQLASDGARYAALGRVLREAPPSGIATIGRGSSAHASQYFAFMVTQRLGRIVAPLPMSLVTLYGARLHARDLLALAISQSGQSPDLVVPMRELAAGGATTVSFVNALSSPLAAASTWAFPLHASPERSVVATRSFIASLVASALLTAHWEGDTALLRALETLPATLREAARVDGPPALEPLAQADRAMVIGRGPGLPVALEAALKLKETCGIQAEAFSAAEVQHGPMSLVGEGYPLLVFALRGPAQASLLELAADMRTRGARVILAAPADIAGRELTLLETGSVDLDPIAAIQRFYVHVEALSRARGRDPDAPPNLSKVTRTR